MIRHHQGRVLRFAEALGRQQPSLPEEEANRKAETLVTALNGIALHRVLNLDFDVQTHARALLGDALEPA